MKTGIELIAEERQEQINKHKFTLDRDREVNDDRQLAIAAKAVIDGEDWNFPAGWDLVFVQKMCNKEYKERLTIAGALIAAELDRLQNP